MKKIGANIFLFTILMGLILLPISSFKLVKQETPEVLSFDDVKEEYLKQIIDEQEKEIQELKQQMEVTETTQGTAETDL